MNAFIETITSRDEVLRNRPFRTLCAGRNSAELLAAARELEAFRQSSENLYERVRASLFLYALHRFYLSESADFPASGTLPPSGFYDLMERRFEEALACFWKEVNEQGATGALCSALAESYHHLSFDTLSDQVRRSVRSSRGNQWMFRVGHPAEHPLRCRPELQRRASGESLYPVLVERTPVRLDLSHSGWSDIFFLGMDYPEGARVLNISVDLGVYGRDSSTRPPVQAYARVITEPVLRITSLDLGTSKDIRDLGDLFNFGNDYLSLLKAGIIASGFIPPSFEGTDIPLAGILGEVIRPGMGMELVTQVNDIPKGSRLAVSTNLLACVIALLMRATGQTQSLTGSLTEEERRLAASRAILGEWLGASGGGWQDSGGIWPGIKVIRGALAGESDPEHGISKGRLLPEHQILGDQDLHPDITERLAASLVLIHGGMAQNVGPILEMVTEKYLLRSQPEWDARLRMDKIFNGIRSALKTGDIKALGACTTQNWNDPLKTIIPWVSNHFTESIISRARAALGDDFWGFLMLGGMSGGGMCMMVAPERREAFRDIILDIMQSTKEELEEALPFAMNPVVYDFTINNQGTQAALLTGEEALLPMSYHILLTPDLARNCPENLPLQRRIELDCAIAACPEPDKRDQLLRTLVGSLFRVGDALSRSEKNQWDEEAEAIKAQNGFDSIQHEMIRDDLRGGRIGLSRNRLPADTLIEDVQDQDILFLKADARSRQSGEEALRAGTVAVLSLAAGVGSRWTTGAGVIKAINPFIFMAGRHRSFLELHLAKTRESMQRYSCVIPHIVSTSFLTHGPVVKHLEQQKRYQHPGPLYLSPGRSIGQRFVPMVRDLLFLWEETTQESLDEQKQKVRDAVRAALIDWAKAKGEGTDYTDNLPIQRFNPPGHWYEVPNLLLNGVLAQLLQDQPQIKTLLLHNIDTLGADLDATALGMHLLSGNALSFEVTPRRIADRGGGLARVNGRLRLLEGLAQPREEDELRLRFYNTMTTWIDVDALLQQFGLVREDLCRSRDKVAQAVRMMARRMPSYVTIKDVKRRWGRGQEDVYPVAQVEKLWSDMSALPDLSCGYMVVPRFRGQQLKDLNQLDAWANDGSKDWIARLCGLQG
ncbi:MAG TPA: UTP--glucose-1-phosphate uridylyltransferase [Candidatus Hydrogenedentes bacterium]|nr:UTP--glucose-1-phosphate uridylyltransferase [Candidatus Hydrogenedentota bacterium]HOD94787.1 UTP--glucose-1-phosphate uridylyltransferase [Candidatus Hydrogenedentota bacterium]HOR50291.1 UTP--glucose-1-phosphate uridylyltransferase [Candidatus Hydrogenedentota bacterium]HPK24220.1 UTP--glucose-1-phosphate uridylyltransferase [Candidatus Hydrogenedentota bacterium]